jgi:hypothetical protein
MKWKKRWKGKIKLIWRRKMKCKDFHRTGITVGAVEFGL